MSKTSSVTDDYIVRELAPPEHEPDEEPIAIICERLGLSGDPVVCGNIVMHLLAGAIPDKARVIPSTLQTRVKRPCNVKASGDATV